MRLKTATITALLFLLMLLLLGLVSENGPLLRQSFNFYGKNVPLGLVLLVSLTVGFIFFGVWLVVSSLAQISQRWISRLSSRNERTAEASYLKGLDAVVGGRPVEAVGHFRRALEAQEDYLPAILKLGDALRETGKAQEAVELHSRALKKNPNDIPTLYTLVEDYLALDNHEEAKVCLHKILKLQPRRALTALRLLRTLYIEETNWPRATEIQKHIERARVLEEERALDTPFTPGLLYQMGVDLLEQNKVKSAISELEKVRKKYPFFLSTYLKLAEAYLRRGDEDAAIAVYLDGYRSNTFPACLLAMERHYLDKGDPEAAIHHYLQLIATTEKKLLPKFLLGRFYYHLELLDKALALFEEIEGSIKQSALLQYYIGRIHQKKNRHADACDHYRRVIRYLHPFELNYRCSGCGDTAEKWQDYCHRCKIWDSFVPTFKDDLMKEIPQPSPVFYEGVQWTKEESGHSS